MQEALSELEELARRVPKEAQIYLQMGKVSDAQVMVVVMKWTLALTKVSVVPLLLQVVDSLQGFCGLLMYL